MLDTEFVNELASSAPTPGGGGASAYCGMLAAALGSMVGELTVGKERYAAVEDDVRAMLADLAARRLSLEKLADADAEAFKPLAASYRMPRTTPEEQEARTRAEQAALAGACEVPLQIMDECAAVIDDCRFMAQNGSRLAVPDAGAASIMAKAALEAASLNVFANAQSMQDAKRAQGYRDHANKLIDEYGKRADDTFAYVCKEIGT